MIHGVLWYWSIDNWQTFFCTNSPFDYPHVKNISLICYIECTMNKLVLWAVIERKKCQNVYQVLLIYYINCLSGYASCIHYQKCSVIKDKWFLYKDELWALVGETVMPHAEVLFTFGGAWVENLWQFNRVFG